MKRSLWHSIPALAAGVMLLLLASSCAQRTAQKPSTTPSHRVAGKQEQYPPTAAPMTTITLTDTALTVSPNSAPAGNVAVKVVNNSKVPQTVSFTGKGMTKTTPMLKPGDSTTMTLTGLKQGSYKATSSGGKGVKKMSTMFTVTAPAKTKVTVTITDTGVTTSPSTIPAGDVTLDVVNHSKVAQSIDITGNGVMKKTKTVLPGKTETVMLTNVKHGSYTVTTSGGKGVKKMSSTLSVQPPSTATGTR